MSLPPSERAEADALLTDLYLDALLAARERHATDAPDRRRPRPGGPRRGARAWRPTSIRVHPSFRFEERLAVRLAEAAARLRLAMAAGGGSLLGAQRRRSRRRSPGDPAEAIGSGRPRPIPRATTRTAAAARCSSAAR